MADRREMHRNFKNKLLPLGNKAGYELFLTPAAMSMLHSISSQYEQVVVELRLKSLASTPRSKADGVMVRTGSIDNFKLIAGHYHIKYRIISGQITVYEIGLTSKAYKDRARKERHGLYYAKKDPKEGWSKKYIQRTTDVTTQYAAVNGMMNDLPKAVWLMGEHLEWQYGEMNEFTLYHNPSGGGMADIWECANDKLGLSTEVAKDFSSVLSKAQQNSKTTISWVAHSQGAIIFSESVRYHLNGGRRFPLLLNGLLSPAKRGSLDRHAVAFHGSGNNHLRSTLLCQRAGITVIPASNNRFDAVCQWAGMNAFTNPSLVNLIGSALFINHVFGGSANQSPHTMAQSMDFDYWVYEVLYGEGPAATTGLQKVLRGAQRAFLQSLPVFDTAEKTVKSVARTVVDNFLR